MAVDQLGTIIPWINTIAVPLLVAVFKLVADIRRDLRAQNGRIGKLEVRADGHEKLDDERHAQLARLEDERHLQMTTGIAELWRAIERMRERETT